MGSKIGWIIALTIVLVVGLVIVFIVFFPSHSEPSSELLREGFTAVKKVDVPVEEVAGFRPSEPGNAGEDYAKAVEIYLAHSKEIQDLINKDQLPGMVLAENLAKIDGYLAAGGAKEKMEYTLTIAPKEIKVCLKYRPLDPADGLQGASQACLLLARQQITKRNFEQAERVLRNVFLLGWHMVEEHARPYMAMVGMQVQAEALDTLEMLYEKWGQPASAQRLQTVRKYLDSLQRVSNFWESKSRIVRTVRPNPGDIFFLITNDEDRAWRVQGLLLLGMLKFTARERGDRIYTGRLMNQYAESRDPMEAAAARAARAMNRQEFQALGTNY